MCDYSLHGIPNRLAVEGEQLIVCQFPTGSKGLASVLDLQKKTYETATSSLARIWARIKDWFVVDVEKTVPAVCVPPGAQLHIENVPACLQEALGVGANEDVTFVQLSAEPFQYRDAIRFANGCEVLLQRLNEGLRLDIVSLGVDEGGVDEGMDEEVAAPQPRAMAPRFEPTGASRTVRGHAAVR